MQIKRQTKLSFYHAGCSLINFIFYQKRGALTMKHSGYLTTSGAEIYYEQYGSGTPLLIRMETASPLPSFIHFCARFCPIFR